MNTIYWINGLHIYLVVGLDEYDWMNGLHISIFAAYFPYFLLLLSAALVIIDRSGSFRNGYPTSNPLFSDSLSFKQLTSNPFFF